MYNKNKGHGNFFCIVTFKQCWWHHIHVDNIDFGQNETLVRKKSLNIYCKNRHCKIKKVWSESYLQTPLKTASVNGWKSFRGLFPYIQMSILYLFYGFDHNLAFQSFDRWQHTQYLKIGSLKVKSIIRYSWFHSIPYFLSYNIRRSYSSI